MDKIKSLQLNISQLSGRRKLALVTCLLLVGFGVSDPDFLGDNGVSTTDSGDSGQSLDGFDEIEAMLADFEAANSEPSDEQESYQSRDRIESTELAVTAIDGDLGTADAAIETSAKLLRNVSYPQQTLTIPAASTSVAVDSHSSSANVYPPKQDRRNPTYEQAEAEQLSNDRRMHIRLTGSIFPSP